MPREGETREGGGGESKCKRRRKIKEERERERERERESARENERKDRLNSYCLILLKSDAKRNKQVIRFLLSFFPYKI